MPENCTNILRANLRPFIFECRINLSPRIYRPIIADMHDPQIFSLTTLRLVKFACRCQFGDTLLKRPIHTLSSEKFVDLSPGEGFLQRRLALVRETNGLEDSDLRGDATTLQRISEHPVEIWIPCGFHFKCKSMPLSFLPVRIGPRRRHCRSIVSTAPTTTETTRTHAH